MKTFNAGSFFSIGIVLELASGTLKSDHGQSDERYLKAIHQKLSDIQNCLNDIPATLSVKALNRICENIAQGSTPELVAQRLDALGELIRDELDSFYFLHLSPLQAEQFSSMEPPFGNAVEVNFPSANDDIYEAAKCLALERATACVMHVMRATEVPLRALAAALGVPAQVDWGSYIREIEKALEARIKASGKRTANEQFYADSVVEFAHVKRAWRNPSMHVDRSYTVERAAEIFAATRSFMRHLASGLCE